MRPSKWDLVLQRKPTPLIDHLVGELGALFADELAQWPPAIDEIDEATRVTLAGLIDTHPHRPGRPAYEVAFTLARWDLEHDVDAVDDYFRNHRYLEAGLAAADRPLVLFLSRLIAEHLLALGEASRLKRPRLLEVLARTRAAFLAKAEPTPRY